MVIAAATAGLAALLAYDFWTIGALRGRIFGAGFRLGLGLWALATVWAIAGSAAGVRLWRLVCFGLPALGCAGLEIYLLFFALPRDTYAEPERRRRVCDSGAYGLCRHPGFWSLAGVYLFLYLALPSRQMLLCAALLTGYNLLYIAVQDMAIFDRIFADYADYRARVPFLVPKCGRRGA